MKNVEKILILLIFLLILTSEDCSNLGSETTAVKTQSEFYSELENDFTTESLSPDNLKAFEERSLQMIDDLVDYLNIYADTGNAVEFRKQSRELIREMFVSEMDLDLFFNLIDIEEDKINYTIRLKNHKNPVFKLESKKTVEGLKYSQWETYEGKNEFLVSILNSKVEKHTVRLNVNLKKVEKQFGQQSNLVWKIFFLTKEP